MTSCACRLGGGGGGVRRSGAKHPDRTLSRRGGAKLRRFYSAGGMRSHTTLHCR